MITVEALAYMVAEGLAEHFTSLKGHTISKETPAPFKPEE